MRVADSGGGTNWAAMTMEQMWVTLENQDTTAHWSLLSGWRKSYELTLQHLGLVQSFRDNLATAWPPDKSPASAAYLERLDDLIKHLQNTYDAAVANYSAFNSATSALADSRRKLKVVYDAYLANKGKIDAYDERMAKGNPGGGTSVARFTAPPPVTDQQQEQLTNQARSIMYGLSTEISQAHASLTKPAEYDPARIVAGTEKDHGGITYAPPVFPPLFPAGESNSSRSSPNISSSHPSPGTTVGHAASQPGLILGGVSPAPTVTSPAPGSVIVPPVPSDPLPGNPTNPSIALPRLPPSAGHSPAIGPTGGGLIRPGVGDSPAGGMRSALPGSVIGMPGSVPGQPGASRAAQRVSPVGGIIHPGSTGSRPSPSRPASGQPGIPFGGNAGRGARYRGDSEAHKWDPDNPWQTDEGVSPVVLPPSEMRFDPGPAIGFDR